MALYPARNLFSQLLANFIHIKTSSMRLIFSLICLVATIGVFAQQQVRRLPYNINQGGRNNLGPYISFDGNHLLFLTDYTEDRSLTLMYTQRAAGSWQEPIELPRSINSRLNYAYGVALNADASRLYFTSARAGGVGKYDIYFAEKRGVSGWSEPQNFGFPVNSTEHDGCPSISADGTEIYFMRCGQMSPNAASACKIFYSKIKYDNTWNEPVELPDFINTGNSQCPRIMADGETLLFSSNQMPGAQGFDLYMTRKTGNSWSQPKPLAFVNTSADDIHVSATAQGRYLLKSNRESRNSELFEYYFSEETRPARILRVEGKILSPDNKAADVNVNIFDLKNNRRISAAKVNEAGTLIVFLKEGVHYELSIEPKNPAHSYHSVRYDLRDLDGPATEKFEVKIGPVYHGDTLTLNGIGFRAYSHVMEETSDLELRRLSRLMLENPDYSFEVGAYQYNYLEDSVLSVPDLTELILDTVYFEKEVFVDSLNRAVTIDSISIHYTYHNDRSSKQARSVVNALIAYGVPEQQIRYAAYRKEYDEELAIISPLIRVRVLKKFND